MAKDDRNFESTRRAYLYRGLFPGDEADITETDTPPPGGQPPPAQSPEAVRQAIHRTIEAMLRLAAQAEPPAETRPKAPRATSAKPAQRPKPRRPRKA